MNAESAAFWAALLLQAAWASAPLSWFRRHCRDPQRAYL
jgi:hypothetical protein